MAEASIVPSTRTTSSGRGITRRPHSRGYDQTAGRVEPLFAEAKQWHHLNKFRLRGRKNVNMKGLLIAAGQNLKRLLQATGWGRQMPGGAAAVLSLGLNTNSLSSALSRCAMGRRIAPRPHLTVAYPGGTSLSTGCSYGPLPQDAVQGPSEVDVWIRCEMVLVRQVSDTVGQRLPT
jgi:hypothetical protein